MDGLAPVRSPGSPDVAPSLSARLERAMFGADGLSFGDLLDVVNPLQHIPVVSTIYRELSHDEIDAGPRMVGSRLFGGWIGLGAAAVDVAVEGLTGRDVGAHVVSWLRPASPAADDDAAGLPGGDATAGLAVNPTEGATANRVAEAGPAIDRGLLRERLLAEAELRAAQPRLALWQRIEDVLGAPRPSTELASMDRAEPVRAERDHAIARYREEAG